MMEAPPYKFQAVTDFSVRNVEKYDSRLEEIKTLTVEIGSKIPAGRHTLVLIEPFPPLGRPGKELDEIVSLRAEQIDSIWVFRESDDGQSPRIEIRGKPRQPNVFVQCERIEGVPGSQIMYTPSRSKRRTMAHASSDKDTNKTIVRAFLAAAGILIEEDGVQDAQEPAPDVLCTFPDRAQIAFELVQAVDQQVARTATASGMYEAQIREYYKNLCPQQRTLIRNLLRNAYISIQPQDGTTDRRFVQVLPDVFRLLLTCSSTITGSIGQGLLPNSIDEIRITRGSWSTGPVFDQGWVAYVGDPTIEQVKKKFSKTYQCDHPIQLLVHSRMYPLGPDEFWKDGLHDFVTRNIRSSPFCRVSVFDWINSTIRYSYPER